MSRIMLKRYAAMLFCSSINHGLDIAVDFWDALKKEKMQSDIGIDADSLILSNSKIRDRTSAVQTAKRHRALTAIPTCPSRPALTT